RVFVIRIAAALLIVGAVLAALSVFVRPAILLAPRIDGVAIGMAADCQKLACNRFEAVAVAWLDRSYLGHSPIRSIEVFEFPVLDAIVRVRSSGDDRAVVLRLADRSMHAVPVGCGIG